MREQHIWRKAQSYKIKTQKGGCFANIKIINLHSSRRSMEFADDKDCLIGFRVALS